MHRTILASLLAHALAQPATVRAEAAPVSVRPASACERPGPACSGALQASALGSAPERISSVLGGVEAALSAPPGAGPGRLFDGSRPRPSRAPASGPEGPDRRRLAEGRDLLSHGTSPAGQPVLPFTFNLPGGDRSTAQAAGLEGFVHQEAELVRGRGKEAVLANLGDYFLYLDALLSPVPWAGQARERIAAIRSSGLPPARKYDELMSYVREYTAAVRRAVASADKSSWVKSARIYEIFPRAFNLPGKRAAAGGRAASAGFFAGFRGSDFLELKRLGFDTVWPMGIFPIGERNRSGTGGGSPYSIKDHSTVNPELGTEDEFKGFVDRAHAAGMRVIIDFVPNHTSMDSRLIQEHPDYFVHAPADPAGPGRPPPGWFDHQDPRSGRRLWIAHGGYEAFGQVSPWIDTAQMDYSNPAARREMSRIVASWITRFGVDGFRVDMAYLDLNSNFSRTWRRAMPEGEFLEAMITEARIASPRTAFIAEAYDNWDELSRAGFDLEYGKNNMSRPGGHHGWYDALASRDPGWIREALRRAAFLRWQKGGAGMLDFVGNHDEASPRRAFGGWMYGASYLTIMMPGNLLFYGSQEIGFDAHRPGGEPKSLPFDFPVQVDWAKADPEARRFHERAFADARSLAADLGEADIEALDGAAAGWAGYLVIGRGSGRAAVVAANPTDLTVEVRVSRPDLGLDVRRSLPPLGYALIRD